MSEAMLVVVVMHELLRGWGRSVLRVLGNAQRAHLQVKKRAKCTRAFLSFTCKRQSNAHGPIAYLKPPEMWAGRVANANEAFDLIHLTCRREGLGGKVPAEKGLHVDGQ
jgi:hypothetical protein